MWIILRWSIFFPRCEISSSFMSLFKLKNLESKSNSAFDFEFYLHYTDVLIKLTCYTFLLFNYYHILIKSILDLLFIQTTLSKM